MICSTTGDLGDIIYLLGILKELPGGPHTLGLRGSAATKVKSHTDVQTLHALISRLVESQSYIKACVIIPDEAKVDWISENFRRNHYQMGRTLMGAHLTHLVEEHNIGHGIRGEKAWLEVSPEEWMDHRIVINRTGRYRKESFPWAEVVKNYRHRLLFIGATSEWREFCGHFGYVEYRPTKDMLEAAELIAGSALFIGNQSACMALAQGIKHPLIQEGCQWCPDCVFPPRPEAQYVFDGAVTLPPVDGSKEKTLQSIIGIVVSDTQTNEVPPGGWRYDAGAHGIKKRSNLNFFARDIANLMGIDAKTAREEIIRYTVSQNLPFFTGQLNLTSFAPAIAALKASGVTDCPLFDIAAGRKPLPLL